MTHPTFLFAHGAGAGPDHPWMQHWRHHLGAFGTVQMLTYPYMQAGRRAPDRLPKLIDAHAAAVSELEGPVVLVGKSMGSRVGCHVANQVPVSAVICFGYPLVGGGKKRTLRDQVLRELHTPLLLIQGTKDHMAPLSTMREVLSGVTAAHMLSVIEGGNHSLQVGKRALKEMGCTQDDIDRQIISSIDAFLTQQGLR